VKVVVVKLKNACLRYYLFLSGTTFVFFIQQYVLMVCVDFSLISYDFKVSPPIGRDWYVCC